MSILAEVSRVVQLQKKGLHYFGLCPFHDEDTPSFCVNVERGTFKCFGCGVGGREARFKKLISGESDDIKFHTKVIANRQKKLKDYYGKEVCAYPYTDENGVLLYEIVRKLLYNRSDHKPLLDKEGNHKKSFTVRRIVNGEYVYNFGETRRVLYNLVEVVKSPQVIITEGEKDVETLRRLGFTATTNSFGANAEWLRAYNRSLVGRRRIIMPDNDKPGQARAVEILNSLAGQATIVNVPSDYKDISEWVQAGATAEDIRRLIDVHI